MKPSLSLFTRFSTLTLMGFLLVGCSREARVAVRLERGDQYYAAQDFGRAELEYLSVLQKDPTNSLAIKRVGLINYQRGVLLRAYSFLEQARQLATNDLEVRLRLAGVYQSTGQIREAREEIKFVLEREPDSDDALLLLAESAMTPEMVAESEQHLAATENAAATRASWHLATANLAFRRADLDAAEAAIARALQLDPNLSPARIAQGTLHWLRGDLEQAERELELAVEHASRYSVRSLKLAEFKWRTGDLDAAAQLLEESTTKTPDFVPGWAMRADIAFEQQRWEDAEAAVRKLLALDPMNHDGLVLMAALEVARGNRTKAITDLNRMIEVYPGSPRAHYTLGLAHAFNQDAPKAIESLGQAIQLDPGDVRPRLLLADIHLRRGEPDPAIGFLRGLLERVPNQVTAQLLLASAYRLKGTPNDAVRVYQDLLTTQSNNGEIYYLLGATLREAGQTNEARLALTRARDLAPDDLRALDQMVELDLAAGLTNAALERVQAEIQRNPDAVGAHVLLAKVHTARLDMDATEQALLRGLEVNPDFGPGYQMLAQLYSRSDRIPQALEKLEDLAARNPKNLVVLMQIGALHTQTGQHAQAAQAYERVLQVDPQFYAALNNLAYLEAEYLGNLDRAIDLARRAHAREPENPATLDTLGWVMIRRGEVAQALPFLRQAAQRAENNPEIQYHLGVAHYLLVQPEPARLALERALATDADFTGRADAERRLATLKGTTAATLEPEALAALEKQVAAHPDDLLSLFRLADARVASGTPQTARTLYERAIQADPKNPLLLVRLAALELDTLQNPTRALELARQAQGLSPQDPQVTAEIGRIAYRAGDTTTALAALQETVRRDPALAAAQLDLALVSYAVGQETAAERALQAALQASSAFPRRAEAEELSFLLRTAKGSTLSPPDAERVARLAQQRTNDLAVLVAAGTVLEHQGKPADAAQYYRRAITLSPAFAPAYARLARTYASALPPASANLPAFVAKARETFPNNAELAKQLGILQFRRTEYTDAAQLLQNAVNTLRTDAETHFYLGLVQAQLKDADKAEANLSRALALNLTEDLAADARRVLQELEQ